MSIECLISFVFSVDNFISEVEGQEEEEEEEEEEEADESAPLECLGLNEELMGEFLVEV